MTTYEEYVENFRKNKHKIKDEVVAWIRDWFSKNGSGCKAVIGISGGKDSSVAAALCVEALGVDHVFGVLMPNGEQSDINVAELLVTTLGIKSVTVNIKGAVEAVHDAIRYGVYDLSYQNEDMSIDFTEQAKINLPPRIRMATLYAVSQSIGGRVVNTCNLSEEFVGYSTRWGDSVGDFSPLAYFTTDEVVMIGEACGLPDILTKKIPIDGLCGKTDEENLGFSYRVLNTVIRVPGFSKIVNEDTLSRILDMNRKTAFKRTTEIPAFVYPRFE